MNMLLEWHVLDFSFSVSVGQIKSTLLRALYTEEAVGGDKYTGLNQKLVRIFFFWSSHTDI